MLASACSAAALFAGVQANAANISSNQTGNWNATSTWVGGVVPVAGDNVTIASNHVVTVTVNAAAATVTVAANAAGSNGITINSGILLDVSGAITMTTVTSGTSTIAVGNGSLNAASIAIPGSNTAGRTCTVSVNNGTITTTGSITFSGTAAQAKFTSTGASTVNVAGNFGSGGTLTTSSTGTINFDGGSPQTIGTYTTFNNVAINNTLGAVTLTGTTTFGGTLTVTNDSLVVGGVTLTVAGPTSISGTLAITSTTGTKTFGDITINNGGLMAFSASENVTANGNLTANGTGTISGNQGTWTFQTAGGGGSIGGTAASLSLTSATFTTAYTIGLPLTVTNTMTVTGTTVTNNATLTVTSSLTGTGGLTQGTGAALNLGGTSGITTMDATANPNQVTYTGSSQTVKATTYYNLTLSGSNTKTLTGLTTVNGDLTTSGTCSATTAANLAIGNNLNVGASTTFTVGGFDITVTDSTLVSGTLAHSSATGTKTHVGPVTISSGGSWTNAGNAGFTFRGGLAFNGTTFTSGTGVYTFDTNSQALSGSTALTISNVTVTGVTLTNSDAVSVTVGTALSGTGQFTQGSGSTLKLGGTVGITSLFASTNPNLVNYTGTSQTVAPTAYDDLTLSGTGVFVLSNVDSIGGDFTMSGTDTATTAIAMTIGGNLTVGTGCVLTVAGFDFLVTGTSSVTGTLAHSSSTGAKLHIGLVTINANGVWTNTGNAGLTFRGGLTHNGTTFTSGSGTYTFDTNAQAIGGTGALSISNVTVTGITLTNNSTNFTVASALSGTGGLTQGSGASLSIGGTSGITALDASASGNTVNYSGAGQTAFPCTYYNLTLSGTGTKTLTNVSTVNGALTTSGLLSATSAIAMTVGSVSIGALTSFTVAGFDFTVTGTTTVAGLLSHSSATGTKTYTGLVTISGLGSWTNGGNSDIDFRGGLTYSGVLFTSGTGDYLFDTNAQAIGGSSALTISNVTVNGVTVTNNSSNFTVSTSLDGTGQVMQGNGGSLKIGGTITVDTLDASVSTNTVNYTGAAQTVAPSTYYNLSVSGSGAKTLPSSTVQVNGNFSLSGTCTATANAPMNIAGNFSLNSNAVFIAGAYTHDIKGNISNNNTITCTGSTITLTGTSDQSISGNGFTFNNLTINKSSGKVTLGVTINVAGVLTFTSGNISTAANRVTINSGGSVSQTSGYVIGNLRKTAPTGANVALTYEVGDANAYAPLNVTFASVSVSGNMTVSTTSGDDPNIASSDIDPNHSVNRFWTLATSGLTYTNFAATFNFVPGDVDAGATPSTFEVRRWTGAAWAATTFGTRNSTSTQITGQTTIGDFQVGNALSVAVSNNVFAFGGQPLNTWLTAQSSIITNDGFETENVVAQISTLTAGGNTWSLSSSANGADQVRAQWSTTSSTGPWTDISAYGSNFTLTTGLASAGTVTLYLRIQTPTSTTSNSQYSSTLTVTAQ